ncbi:MAG: hypothetical protein ACFFC5_04150 [Promethearchaeota archaeon]
MDILRKLRTPGPETVRRDDMILISEEKLDKVKCGICGRSLTVKVYALGNKMMRQICCEICNAEVWK